MDISTAPASVESTHTAHTADDLAFHLRFGFMPDEVLHVIEPNQDPVVRQFYRQRTDRHNELYATLHPQLFEEEAEMRLEILASVLG